METPALWLFLGGLAGSLSMGATNTWERTVSDACLCCVFGRCPGTLALLGLSQGTCQEPGPGRFHWRLRAELEDRPQWCQPTLELAGRMIDCLNRMRGLSISVR